MEPELRADCARCTGLCCVAPAFAASADFAIDKPAGHPCPNLAADFRCGIHARLRERGFPGCTVFDCFGAGQHVTQVTFGGTDWRSTPDAAEPMFAAFSVVRSLHELLWYLDDALTRPAAAELHPDLARAAERTRLLARGTAAELATLDVAAQRQAVNALLLRTSELVRSPPGPDRRRADLTGRDLRGAHLRGASLRGALLIGADLTGADLRTADVIGADLRATDVSGADLTGALFLTQFQVNAARGSRSTLLPDTVTRPSHWTR